MQTDKQDKILGYIIGGAAIAMVIIGVCAFLFTTNDAGHTGWEVIKYQGTWYLTTMSFFALLGIGSLIGGWVWYDKSQEGDKGIAGIIVAAIFFGIAFGKGCTDKDEDGVTGPKGRLPQTEVHADSTQTK